MIAAFDLPDDYYGAYERNIEAVSLDDVRRVANERIQSEELTLLIVGDREVIESGLAELGLPIRYVDHPHDYPGAAPLLGQHTEAVLSEVLGLDANEIARLRAAGVL